MPQTNLHENAENLGDEAGGHKLRKILNKIEINDLYFCRRKI